MATKLKKKKKVSEWSVTLPIKIYKWQMSIWKNVQYYLPLRNWKLKQEHDTTTYLLKFLKSKNLTYQILTKMQRATEPPIHCWWECKMVQSLVEDSLAAFYKVKYTFTIWSKNYAPRYLRKYFENICPHKTWHIYSMYIRNFQKSWKQLKFLSICEWINSDKHTHNGVLFSNF